ncbi:MAG: metal ABC transporter ATP-binding protein [Tissierellia bacterium]|nr:metal ABC transporter ATP-binding protein [Tissierellia bacterium]
MNCITMDNISFGYTDDLVLEDLNLSMNTGDLVTLIGENGSGKSTILKLILGEIKPQKGKITILGQDSNKMSSYREIGYVPQMNIVNAMAFPVTCLELVVLNLYEDFGFIKIPKKRHKEKAIKIMEEMGLRQYLNVPFNELSGGLMQRVMITRAMINSPKILIMDEPTAGVDQESKENFFKFIEDLNENNDISILLVTHELDMVKEYLKLDHVFRVKNGDVEDVVI